jgi:hypothetical protein
MKLHPLTKAAIGLTAAGAAYVLVQRKKSEIPCLRVALHKSRFSAASPPDVRRGDASPKRYCFNGSFGLWPKNLS